MKIFLYIMLLLHVLMEGIVGLALIFSPTTMEPTVGSAGLQYLIVYGCAGVTMSLVVAWFWPLRHRAEVLGMVLGILSTFHTAIASGGALIASQGGPTNIVIGHTVMAVIFWFLWARRKTLAT